MLHLVYILAFTVIAFFAISNLIRSLVSISVESQKRAWINKGGGGGVSEKGTHPELFDKEGKPIDEPLLVIRSVSLEEARRKLDSLYESSPGNPEDTQNS
ncbi:MAG: DUF2973 domain-containing protein [Geminocystis sp.]|nr:DUF2973 domain-containing protein [Geminocystis sp.]HIK38565.1 DUF2973 domain-containing protein [Geminocystis sp. M7585_C2015_104]MCS7147346.1 DUF2973 domain-containing protein [Geminocystis sp.]MCX8079072.1 DUF2973 domain-containing protein [Geminocystis sp.]MDW8116345.1 DUF2973 domain-containing protein [Geminocystis sp.]